MESTSVVYRNRIYWNDGITGTTASRVWELDPILATATNIPAPWISVNTGANFSDADLCVAFDKLFCAAQDSPGSAGGRLTLYEFTGGGWSLNSNITPTQQVNQVDGTQGKHCLWTDNTNLYVVGYTERDASTTPNIGSAVWRGVPSGSTFTWSQNDVTTPAGLQPGARGVVGLAREDRWSIYVDNNTNPAAPAYYLIVIEGPAPGTGHAIYRWEGFGVEMGSGITTSEVGPGASVSSAFGLPEVKHGGGEAISQGTSSFAEIELETPVLDGYMLSYRVRGAAGPFTGRVYYSSGQGPPDTLATFVGAGTTINSVTGDSGASLRTVIISLTLSGITAPDASNWMIDLR